MIDNLIVRHGNSADIPAVVDLIYKNLDNFDTNDMPPKKSELGDYVQNAVEVLVAVVDTSIVGVLLLHQCACDGLMPMRYLCVEESLRRHHIATHLVKNIDPSHELILWCKPRLVEFFCRNGFEVDEYNHNNYYTLIRADNER